MIPRRLPPVSSPLGVRALGGALLRAPRGGKSARAAVATTLRERFDARRVVLTDSGTAALGLAMRAAAGRGSVAIPAYGCPDLLAAAAWAGVRVRLYDLDVATLAPRLDSVARALEAGSTALVVTHLFGLAVDLAPVRALCEPRGVVVIEDAAQGAGGTLRGAPLGAHGALSVLSFGRGKGLTAGRGGALLVRDERFDAAIDAAVSSLGASGSGARDFAVASAQMLLGGPALFAIPSAVPGLRLGEMIYHELDAPRAMAHLPAMLLVQTLRDAAPELRTRRANAERLRTAAAAAGIRTPIPCEGSEPGFLRFPILLSADTAPVPALGIVRPYPRSLATFDVCRTLRDDADAPMPDASLLAAELFTLPTHGRLAAADVERLAQWLRSRSVQSHAGRGVADGSPVPARTPFESR